MRLAILTDLHANREAVEAVLEHAAAQRIDRYALLGDFVGYGADPAWVVELARDFVRRGAIAVQGNHDIAVVNGPSPSTRCRSVRQTPQAVTRMRTWPGPGAGRAARQTACKGRPAASSTIASGGNEALMRLL